MAKGWGAKLGFPALVPDPKGGRLDVQLFESEDLPHHWARLDAFEGCEYRRIIIPVETTSGKVSAWIYISANVAA